MAARVHEKLQDILESHAAPALADKILTAIQAIRDKGLAELEKAET
jgi:trimethylamine:corrinoid methyltransferase-like protein